MKAKEIHEEGLKVSFEYLNSEKRLISLLGLMDDCKGYRDYKYPSLFVYAVEEWKLPRDRVYVLIGLARKSKEVPALKGKIEADEISISNARMIAPVLTPENQEHWLAQAANLSKRELEREIKREYPEKAVQERARYISEDRLELKLGISEDLLEKLKRVQDLLSQRLQRNATLEETLEDLAEFYLEKKDPVVKLAPERVVNEKPLPEPDLIGFPAARKHLAARLRRAIIRRDQGQCTYQDGSKRCLNRRFIQSHHKTPISEGGQDRLENMQTLCAAHHKLLHHRAS